MSNLLLIASLYVRTDKYLSQTQGPTNTDVPAGLWSKIFHIKSKAWQVCLRHMTESLPIFFLHLKYSYTSSLLGTAYEQVGECNCQSRRGSTAALGNANRHPSAINTVHKSMTFCSLTSSNTPTTLRWSAHKNYSTQSATEASFCQRVRNDINHVDAKQQHISRKSEVLEHKNLKPNCNQVFKQNNGSADLQRNRISDGIL